MTVLPNTHRWTPSCDSSLQSTPSHHIQYYHTHYGNAYDDLLPFWISVEHSTDSALWELCGML